MSQMANLSKETQERIERWFLGIADEELYQELKALSPEELNERFYRYLEFGTGGMRGELGVGTNRMNRYTVLRATEGLARYIEKVGPEAKNRGVVLSHDSRHKSRPFAEESALLLNRHGVKAYLFDDLRPTPELSFAVRELKAVAGIMITASHNPPEYNGYKVYWEDGGQIPPMIADALMKEIDRVEDELSLKPLSKEEAIKEGLLVSIGKELDERYYARLQELVLQPDMIRRHGEALTIVYTPLHGTGNRPVREILSRVGFSRLHVVKEQELPDPDFHSVKSPNPEERAAFTLAIEEAKRLGADLILGTDPDADRVGAVVQDRSGEYVVLTGNQTGALLLHYLLSERQKKGDLPKNGVVIKTIVTSELGRAIASSYGIETLDVLTGFKFIGEKIKEFEETGEKKFLFGYEESYGYLVGDFVRDKDAVQACLLIAEMALSYKRQGKTLYDALLDLYKKYGTYREGLVSITLKGLEGSERIKKIMSSLREHPVEEAAGLSVQIISDYKKGITYHLKEGREEATGLPLSDVLRYTLEGGSWFAVRPSGTEPKIKIYFGTVADDLTTAENLLEALKTDVMARIQV